MPQKQDRWHDCRLESPLFRPSSGRVLLRAEESQRRCTMPRVSRVPRCNTVGRLPMLLLQETVQDYRLLPRRRSHYSRAYHLSRSACHAQYLGTIAEATTAPTPNVGKSTFSSLPDTNKPTRAGGAYRTGEQAPSDSEHNLTPDCSQFPSLDYATIRPAFPCPRSPVDRRDAGPSRRVSRRMSLYRIRPIRSVRRVQPSLQRPLMSIYHTRPMPAIETPQCPLLARCSTPPIVRRMDGWAGVAFPRLKGPRQAVVQGLSPAAPSATSTPD